MSHQLTELYRRGIVRPLDERARDQLYRYHVDVPIRCEWLPILGEEGFATIWDSGLLQAIGRSCNLRITDYEEIMLESDRVGLAVNSVKNFLLHHRKDESHFAESLLGLLQDAETSGMPVLLVL